LIDGISVDAIPYLPILGPANIDGRHLLQRYWQGEYRRPEGSGHHTKGWFWGVILNLVHRFINTVTYSLRPLRLRLRWKILPKYVTVFTK